MIQYAKGKGLKVILMPIVLLDDPKGDEWRGTLKPESWSKWFESYRGILGHFCWIAESNDVDIFVIGSELVSAERQAAEWDKTVRFVRERFSGLITYSSNWDHYKNIPFWEKLDLIGMNSYWTLGPDENASVEVIKQNWRDIQRWNNIDNANVIEVGQVLRVAPPVGSPEAVVAKPVAPASAATAPRSS